MKDWTTVKKGDKLYTLIPFATKSKDSSLPDITYVYQESKVIHVYVYTHSIEIRFKYTDHTGKRRRTCLRLNKLKYNQEYLSTDARTAWAAQFEPEFGDIIVTFKNKEILNDAYKHILKRKIEEEQKLIEDHKAAIQSLNEKYHNIV